MRSSFLSKSCFVEQILHALVKTDRSALRFQNLNANEMQW